MIAAVLIVGAAFFYLKFNLSLSSAGAQLIINFENGQGRKFAGAVVADMTILEALHASSRGDSFELRYSLQKDGTVALARIGDAINFGERNWHFYLNKKQINTADIGKIKIEAGDFIEAKYE